MICQTCVLTGRNGSGKSHLLEAIANTQLSSVSLESKRLTVLHYIPFNGLNPAIDEQCDYSQIVNNIKSRFGYIVNLQQNLKMAESRGEIFNDELNEFIPRHLPINHPDYFIFKRIIEKSKKALKDITEDDVSQNISFSDSTQNNLFFSQFALIFKAYHARKDNNNYAQYRFNALGDTNAKFLSEDDFFKTFGPPPWQLVNDTLAKAKLPYEVTSPEGSDRETTFRLRLIDKEKNIELSVNDLSTGEKVLMSLSLAIYNTQEGGTKPDLLLLDEPDAPLHPEYSKLLIDTITEIVVKKAGVKVLLTTHSPSTVAICPPDSVYEMDRKTKTPRMINISQGIEILTYGIKNLRVSYETRRQIFVESSNDVKYFQKLYDILNRIHSYECEAIFLEPHSGTSNCSDVIDIVKKLTENGSDLARGIIDYDNKNKEETYIKILGESGRYSIENYILDPIFIALSLIWHRKINFSDYGINELSTFVDASKLNNSQTQILVDYILKKLNFHSNDTECELENGFKIKYPKEFLFIQGHEYEKKLTECFPELGEINRGKGDAALKLGILKTIEEYPSFLPRELHLTFMKTLA